jgi:hypothetical protein
VLLLLGDLGGGVQLPPEGGYRCSRPPGAAACSLQVQSRLRQSSRPVGSRLRKSGCRFIATCQAPAAARIHTYSTHPLADSEICG